METPQDISEYKMKWKSHAFTVPIHSDIDWQCKDWCRKNLQRWEWSMTAYTGVYEHTFLFEKEEHAKEFIKIWTRLH